VTNKQVIKEFFSKFGAIRKFIIYPKRRECTVEYASAKAAAKVLSAQVDFNIFLTPAVAGKKMNEGSVDPDVQSELESMAPVGIKKHTKQGKLVDSQCCTIHVKSHFQDSRASSSRP